MNPVNMTDIQTLTMQFVAQDAEGNPTTLQAPIVVTPSDPTFGTVAPAVVNSDGSQTIAFKPATVAGKLGAVTLSATTQSPDPILTTSVSVNVAGSAAASLGVQVSVA